MSDRFPGDTMLSMNVDAADSAFGELLRQWRTRRGRTQFELSEHAGFSQRHLSFLESGRSKPSRSTVVILADALEVPVGDRNRLLQSAGFAPLYSAEPLDSVRLRHALAALETVLESHRPFPALIVDRSWNLVRANASAVLLFQRFLPDPAVLAGDKPVNVMKMSIEPSGLRQSIVNWPAFAAAFLPQLKSEALRAPNRLVQEIIELIEQDPEYQARGRDAAEAVRTPVATMQLERNGERVELFTLLSLFGAPTDSSLSELRVETFFPANDASREVLLRIDADYQKAQQ